MEIKIPCECAGGEKYCDTLYILEDRGDIEINLKRKNKNGQSRILGGSYLFKDGKGLKRLKKLFNPSKKKIEG